MSVWGRKQTRRKHFPTSTQIGFILPDEPRITPTDRPEPVEGPPAPPPAARASVLSGAAALHAQRLDRHAPGAFPRLTGRDRLGLRRLRVRMSRNSAYKLRRKPHAESVAAAWDAALGEPVRRVTIDDLPYLAYHGLIRPRFRGGKYVGSWQKPDNTALLRLLARLNRSAHGRHGEGDRKSRKRRVCVARRVTVLSAATGLIRVSGPLLSQFGTGDARAKKITTGREPEIFTSVRLARFCRR